MYLKDLKVLIDGLYKKHGNIDCMIRDDRCIGYGLISELQPHIANRGNDNDKVLVIDLPKKSDCVTTTEEKPDDLKEVAKIVAKEINLVNKRVDKLSTLLGKTMEIVFNHIENGR